MSEEIAALRAVKRLLLDHRIPESYPECTADCSYQEMHTAGVTREDFIPISAFPLISYDWVRPLAKFIGDRPCLEIMAGTGMLSKALQDCGVNIVATDNFMWRQTHWFDKEKPLWCDVKCMDCTSAIETYSIASFVFCSWPYMDDTAYNALKTLRKVNPDCKMIYIGEPEGGCTASKRFFDAAIVEHESDSNFVEAQCTYKNWWGIHDQIYLLR